MASIVNRSAFTVTVPGYRGKDKNKYTRKFAYGTGIVRALREASETLSEGGLTRLDRARDWIAAHHPDQTPSKYGCRTWPQVLSESKLFELVYRVGDDGKRVGWFRERLAS